MFKGTKHLRRVSERSRENRWDYWQGWLAPHRRYRRMASGKFTFDVPPPPTIFADFCSFLTSSERERCFEWYLKTLTKLHKTTRGETKFGHVTIISKQVTIPGQWLDIARCQDRTTDSDWLIANFWAAKLYSQLFYTLSTAELNIPQFFWPLFSKSLQSCIVFSTHRCDLRLYITQAATLEIERAMKNFLCLIPEWHFEDRRSSQAYL